MTSRAAAHAGAPRPIERGARRRFYIPRTRVVHGDFAAVTTCDELPAPANVAYGAGQRGPNREQESRSGFTQRRHRIDPRRRPRRQVAGRERDDDQHQGGDREHDRIVRPDAEELALQQASARKCSD